jgi:hypothetical protein
MGDRTGDTQMGAVNEYSGLFKAHLLLLQWGLEANRTTDGARASETPTPSAAGDDSEETAEGIIAPATLSSTEGGNV